MRLSICKFKSYPAVFGLAALLFLTVTSIMSQTDPRLEITVEAVSCFPGEQGVTIPAYMNNYDDTIAGFNLWLILDRPDIMEFEINLDLSNTLMENWEQWGVNSLGGQNHDLVILGVSNFEWPYPDAIPPQEDGLPLFKIIADIYDISDTIIDRTVNIHVVIENTDHFGFSDPNGNLIGVILDSLPDTTWYLCTQWITEPDSICANWIEIPGPPADSFNIDWVTYPRVDTSAVTVTDGSLTVLKVICGDIDGSGGDPNVADLTYFVDYLFRSGPPPPVPEMADINNQSGINVADLTYLVDYLFNQGAAPNCEPDSTQPIIGDHQACPDFDLIPSTYLDQIKSDYRIWYVHTSHGSQVVTGMSILRDSSNLYDYNNGPGSLYLEEYSDDLGHNGDTSWVILTRQRLDQPENDINLVMWSWCGGVSDNTEEGIDIYLNTVNQLEQDYPGITFIYMTGHLDGTGPAGNLYLRNNQVRAYCTANNKTLFDFADIESYDPDGTYYPDESDYCDWCYDWCAEHPCPTTCSCAHSQCFNCYQKGKAFWWMMARLAGWDGN